MDVPPKPLCLGGFLLIWVFQRPLTSLSANPLQKALQLLRQWLADGSASPLRGCRNRNAVACRKFLGKQIAASFSPHKSRGDPCDLQVSDGVLLLDLLQSRYGTVRH